MVNNEFLILFYFFTELSSFHNTTLNDIKKIKLWKPIIDKLLFK